MIKKDCIAMLLAGGQGSRLGNLTKKIAKPAIPFGGKYRVIDFALSNCYHSGIYTVGVLTQYRPLELHNYIGIGSAWDLDRRHGGVFILPPYASEKKAEWYSGTADSIYQNINFIDMVNPEHVAILSGDHVYKMDYHQMLRFHKEKNADVTIAVIDVPMEEASRFGIMSIDENKQVTEFEEKPKKPKSTLASMGVYIFHWQVLRRYLIEDRKNEKSSHDFGKDVIPSMLANKEKLFTYRFDGYWRDVGTIDSYWQANMDLLEDPSWFETENPSWIVGSENLDLPPHFIGETGSISHSLVSEGCQIHGTVENSILFPCVIVEKDAVIRNSVVMAETHVGEGAQINKAIIGKRNFVMKNKIVGKIEPDADVTVVISSHEIKSKSFSG